MNMGTKDKWTQCCSPARWCCSSPGPDGLLCARRAEKGRALRIAPGAAGVGGAGRPPGVASYEKKKLDSTFPAVAALLHWLVCRDLPAPSAATALR